jgi:hypothetical protein
MDKEKLLARLREGVHEPYQLGSQTKGTAMIPIDYECAIPVEAGPLQFLVEPRILTDAAVSGVGNGLEVEGGGDAPVFDDNGPTVHVMGAEDGLEHLRFDCFLNKPHYHYVRYSTNELFTVRLDQFAEGDPIDWTVDHLRRRLPEMLEFAGSPDLAEAVRDQNADVLAAIDQVEKFVRSSKEQMAQAPA